MVTTFICDSCGRITTSVAANRLSPCCGKATHLASESANEILIPKCAFGTDFIAVVYRGKVVNLLVASDRSSVHGCLSDATVQQYVDRFECSEPIKATDIEVKEGNNTYCVQSLNGVPKVLVRVDKNDDYVVADGLLHPFERDRIIEIARDQEQRNGTPGDQQSAGGRRKPIQGIGETNGLRAPTMGWRKKLEQFRSAAKRTIGVVWGPRRGRTMVRPSTAAICEGRAQTSETQGKRDQLLAGHQKQAKPNAVLARTPTAMRPSSKRILVVENTDPTDNVMAADLASVGCECWVTAGVLEALALLRCGERFDLMLSALPMSGLDGIGLLERTKDEYPDMSVVIVAGPCDISFALDTIRIRADDYLLKPFYRGQLLHTVGRVLAGRSLKHADGAYVSDPDAQIAKPEIRPPSQSIVVKQNREDGGSAAEEKKQEQEAPDCGSEQEATKYTEYDVCILKSFGVSTEQNASTETGDGLRIPPSFADLPRTEPTQPKQTYPEIPGESLRKDGSGPFIDDQWRDILAGQRFTPRIETMKVVFGEGDDGEDEKEAEVWRSQHRDAMIQITIDAEGDPMWRCYIHGRFVEEGDDSNALLSLIKESEPKEAVMHEREPNDEDKKWMKGIGIEIRKVKSPSSNKTEKPDGRAEGSGDVA